MFFGLSTAIYFRSRDISNYQVDLIKKSGIKFLEITPFHDVSEEVLLHIKNIDMEIFSVHADYLNSDISSRDEKSRRESIGIIALDITKAISLGAGLVIIHPGIYEPDTGQRGERLANCIKSLIEIVNFASGHDIRIAVENLPGGFLCDNYEELQYVVSKVKEHFLLHGNHLFKDKIGVCVDTGHAFLTGCLDRLIYGFKSDILTMHLHDNNGDNGRDKATGFDDLHYAPGSGKIDWDKFFKDLKAIKYDSALILEVISLNADHDADANRQHLLNSLEQFISARIDKT